MVIFLKAIKIIFTSTIIHCPCMMGIHYLLLLHLLCNLKCFLKKRPHL